MIREYIIKISDEIMEEEIADRPQELVRCKDCKYQGNTTKCLLAAVAEEKGFMLFLLDNRGEWYCADGERKEVK